MHHSCASPTPASPSLFPQEGLRQPAPACWLESDFATLQSHMDSCAQSRGRFFRLRAALERMLALASPRIVTSTSLCVACCMVVVLAFS